MFYADFSAVIPAFNTNSSSSLYMLSRVILDAFLIAKVWIVMLSGLSRIAFFQAVLHVCQLFSRQTEYQINIDMLKSKFSGKFKGLIKI